MNPKNLEEVTLKLEEDISRNHPDLYFDYAGIIPTTDKEFRYDLTPLNSFVFARTGGDGVHYSFFEVTDEVTLIIMTVPCNYFNRIDEANIILAESLFEFLGLGYYKGWFSLEQICYNEQSALSYFSEEKSDNDSSENGEDIFIKKLREVLNYDYVKLDLNRLNDLKMKYFNLLKFDPKYSNDLK